MIQTLKNYYSFKTSHLPSIKHMFKAWTFEKSETSLKTSVFIWTHNFRTKSTSVLWVHTHKEYHVCLFKCNRIEINTAAFISTCENPDLHIFVQEWNHGIVLGNVNRKQHKAQSFSSNTSLKIKSMAKRYIKKRAHNSMYSTMQSRTSTYTVKS